MTQTYRETKTTKATMFASVVVALMQSAGQFMANTMSSQEWKATCKKLAGRRKAKERSKVRRTKVNRMALIDRNTIQRRLHSANQRRWYDDSLFPSHTKILEVRKQILARQTRNKKNPMMGKNGGLRT